MSVSYSFKVEHYQINCSGEGVGEAAIMLILRAQDGKDFNIVYSILIDCGLAGGAAEQALETINRIQKKYKCDLKFDAVSISHWDRDHYKGFIRFMELGPTKWEEKKGTDTCRWFKYDEEGKPLTYLYGQDWVRKIGTFFIKGRTTPDGAVPLSFMVKGVKKKNVCYGRLSSETVMGTNLVRNATLPSGTPWPTIGGLGALLEKNPPWNDSDSPELQGLPGLYAVGVNDQILGGKKFFVINTNPNAVAELNRGSILLLLVWNNKPDPPIVSFYSGGDAEFPQEERLSGWLNGTKVAVVKAGHHGSRIGTSTNFMSATNPDHFLVSAGRQHGHPVPELVFYLDAWFANKMETSSTTDKDRIYSTCFPYYMGICKGDTSPLEYISHFQKSNFVNPDRFKVGSTEAGVADYQKALLDLYLADPSSNSLEELRASLRKNPSASGQRTLLTKEVRKQWCKWSRVTQDYYPFRGSSLESYRGSCQSLLCVQMDITPKSDGISFSLISDESVPLSGSKSKKEAAEREISKRPRTLSSGTRPPATSSNELTESWQGPEIIASVDPVDGEVLWPLAGVRNVLVKDDEEEDNNRLGIGQRKGRAPAVEIQAREVGDRVSNEYSLRFNAVYASTHPSSETSGLKLQENTPEDFFLRQTETGCLQLSDYVSVDTGNPKWKAIVSPNDDLAQWWCELFSDYGTNSSSFELSATGNSIDGFKMTRLPFGKTDTSPKLVFSSDISVLEKLFQIPKGTLSSKLDNNGIRYGTYDLVLGLDIDSCEHIDSVFSLSSLCRFLGMNVPLKWLESNIELTLQTHSISPDGGGNLPIINAVWFMPGYNYQTAWRLHAAEPAAQSSLKSTLLSKLLPGWTIDSASLVFTKTLTLLTQEEMSTERSLLVHARVHLDIETYGAANTAEDYWDAYISFYDDSVEVTLRWNGTQSPMDAFLNWMGKQSSALDDFKSFEKGLESLYGSSQNSLGPNLRQVWFKVEFPPEASGPLISSYSINSLTLDFEVDVTWDSSPSSSAESSKQLPLIFTFSWTRWSEDSNTSFRLVGSMWPSSIEGQDIDAYSLSSSPPKPPPLRPLITDYATTISLQSLPGMHQLDTIVFDNLPREFRVQFSGLNIEVTANEVSFSGTMTVNPPADNNNSHSFPLVDFDLDAVWNFGSNSKPSLSFNAIAPLTPNPGMKVASEDDDENPIPLCICSINYNAGLWILRANVEDLNGRHLYSLFPKNGDADTIMRLLGEVSISVLDITYTYDRASSSSCGDTFAAKGLLRLGETVDLVLTFNLTNSKLPTWEFSADFIPDPYGNNGKINLGTLASSFSSELGYLLPQFLLQLELEVNDESKISLRCQKSDGDNPTTILGISAEIRGFKFSFVQVLKKGDTNPPKRMLRFTVGTLPAVQTIPLINNLPQPFDRMDFLWLSNDFSEKDVTLLNAEFLAEDPLLYVNPVKQVTSNPKRRIAMSRVAAELRVDPVDPVVLTAGSHFFIINRNTFGVSEIILDYDFHTKSEKDAYTRVSTLANIADSGDNKTKSAPFSAKVGPLSISGLGLSYKDGNVVISLDASISIGPVTGTLNSFSLSMPVNKLIKLDAMDLAVALQGIGLSFDKHPVSISGLLVEKGPMSWAGGVSIHYDPYAFMAGGTYQTIQAPSGATASDKKIETVFVFARLDGPLVELEFATISGITGGFGYNSAMTLPNVDNVTQFPFLQENLPGDTLTVLDHFLSPDPIAWFSLAEGQFWLAAGLTCTAFQVLNIQAVATVSWGNQDTKLGVFANCTAKCPLTAKSDDELFLLVDLGIVAVVDQAKGIFHCEGELLPNSFVLNRSCHLKGGFALCYWFKGSGYEGDWVFTVGGYHSCFKPPSHYPVPSRLGISWNFDSSISISGEAYFAITPKACMGGGKLQVTFQDGPLHAYFDAWADFLVNYRPFRFVGDIGVSVGIGFTIHIWFFTINFNVHFGASVHLHGPPMAGYVFVDWDIISFTIQFGDSNPPNDPLNWDEMWALLKQIDSSGGNQNGAVHVFAATGGLTTSEADTVKVTAKTDDEWTVTPGQFEFTLKSLFPITRFDYRYSDDKTLSYDSLQSPTFIKPMHVTEEVTSYLQIEIKSDKGLYVWFPAMPILEAVPTALWGPYDPAKDPNAGHTVNDLLDSAGSTVSQLMGIQFQTPPPKLSQDNMCPFPVREVCSFFVFGADEPSPKIPAPGHLLVQDTWFPDPDPQKRQQADAKTEWKTGADVLLSNWRSAMNNLGIPPEALSKMYDGFNTTLPKAVFEKWNECFPVSPLVSMGST